MVYSWTDPNDPSNGPRETSQYQGPNSRYGEIRGGGWTWRAGADEDWSRDHYIDPNTGAIRSRFGGPVGAPPAATALQWQTAHEQAVWDIRNRLMQSAAKYGQGNLHLMQSFRPGGGATIEAGTYGQMAGIQLNRASMMEPMDYLADYRRESGANQARAARRAQERQMYIGAGIAVASVVAGALTGGAGTAAIGALGGLANAYNQNKAAEDAARTEANNQSYANSSMREVSAMPYGAGAPGGTSGTGSNPYNREQVGPQAGGGGGGYGAALQPEAGGGNSEQQQAPKGSQPVAGGPMGGKGGQGAQGGPQAAGGAPAGFQAAGVGIDGNFTPTAYAANGAAQSNPVVQTYLLKQVADGMDNDPFYDAFSMTVDRQMAARMGAA